jgi:hypothetical protein
VHVRHVHVTVVPAVTVLGVGEYALLLTVMLLGGRTPPGGVLAGEVEYDAPPHPITHAATIEDVSKAIFMDPS